MKVTKKNVIPKKLLGGTIFPLLVLSITMIFFISATTLAAYTNSRHAQRTIATYETTGDKFSSNLLAKRNSRDNVKMLYVSSASVTPKRTVTICNYEQNKQTQPYELDITYTLMVQLVKYDAETVDKYIPVDAEYLSSNSLTGAGYAVSLKKGETTVDLGASHLSDSSFGGTLTGNTASEDVYSLTFGTSFAPNNPNLYVEIVATPSGGFLPTLRGIFKAGLRSEGISNAWSGNFRDDTSILPNAYDGYNYSVIGQGSGVCSIEWNATKLQISAVSLNELLAIDGATSEGSTVTFPVDSDVNSRYDIQFYKTNITSITTETWDDMNETVVQFSFH